MVAALALSLVGAARASDQLRRELALVEAFVADWNASHSEILVQWQEGPSALRSVLQSVTGASLLLARTVPRPDLYDAADLSIVQTQVEARLVMDGLLEVDLPASASRSTATEDWALLALQPDAFTPARVSEPFAAALEAAVRASGHGDVRLREVGVRLFGDERRIDYPGPPRRFLQLRTVFDSPQGEIVGFIGADWSYRSP